MPRQRKPQNGGQRIGTGRVANTTTGSTTTQAVYRIPTGNRRECDVRNFEVTWISPIVVQIEWENVYRISLDSGALQSAIEWYTDLDLSNVAVTLNSVSGPVTITGNLDIESWELTVDSATITTLTSTTWTITDLTTTTASLGAATADSATIDWLTVTNNATVWGTLGVDWATTLNSTLSVLSNISGGWNISAVGTVSADSVSANTWTITTLTSTTWTITDLTVSNAASVGNGLAVVWGVTADSVTTSWNLAVGWNASITWDATVTWASTFTWAVSTNNITSTWTANLNDVVVGGNETVAWTLWVTWATTLNNSLTVAWASTLSGNTSVWGNLSVAWNSTVTWNQTVTGDAIFSDDVSVAKNLTVSGDTTISDDLVVNGTTSLKALETDGSVDIDGTLRTTWAIVWGNGASITWQIESDTIRTWEVVSDEVRVTDWLYLSAWAEAPEFILQSEKNQPNGVATLDANGQIDTSYLPDVYTTAIVKLKTWIFDNSNTAIVQDADIKPGSAVFCTNYSDIVWDLDEIINQWQLTVVSNQTETGSFMVVIIKPLE